MRGKVQMLCRMVLVGAWMLLVLLRGPALVSRAWSNAGLITLASALVAAPDEPSLNAIDRAESLLCQAVAWDSENRGAYRGLGWALAVQGEGVKAAAEWRAGGFTVQDFIKAGEAARRTKRYEKALGWYEWAVEMDMGLADPWYYTGLVYEELGAWEKALRAYKRAVDVGAFIGVGRSSPYYRMGMIYQWRLEPRQASAALVAYETAIETDHFSSTWEAADCHYMRGGILQWMGGDLNVSIAEFQRAIVLNPRHAWAHIRLGLAAYTRDADAGLAERELLRAVELIPQNKWSYYYLGEIYRREGRIEEARVRYRQALEIDPEFEMAQEHLMALEGTE